jgi:hypothetical protein
VVRRFRRGAVWLGTARQASLGKARIGLGVAGRARLILARHGRRGLAGWLRSNPVGDIRDSAEESNKQAGWVNPGPPAFM